MYGLCYKYLKNEEDAKDAVTDIFEIILEKLKTHQVDYFKSWLYMVSKNQLIRIQSKNNSLEIIDIENVSEKFMESGADSVSQ